MYTSTRPLQPFNKKKGNANLRTFYTRLCVVYLLYIYAFAIDMVATEACTHVLFTYIYLYAPMI